MRGRKQHLLSNKNRKQFADKRAKPRKRVKLSSEDWYQKSSCGTEHKKLVGYAVA